MIVCPICNTNTKIEKVSAKVKNAPPSRYITQQLLPPEKPKEQSLSKIYSCLTIFGIGGGLLMMAGMSGAYDEGIFWDVFNIAAGLFWITVGILAIGKGRKERAKAPIKHAQEIKIWNKKMNIWDSLYYCERDDIVFIPGLDEYAKPEDLNSWITDLAKRKQ